jgi:hypothetical protein
VDVSSAWRAPNSTYSATMAVDDIEKLGPKEVMVMTREFATVSNGSSLEGVIRARKERKSISTPPSVNVFKHPKQWVKQEYLGWRFYTVLYASLAVAVFLWNFLALVGVIAVHGIDANGRITVHTGKCAQIKKTNMYIHWFISVFGTGYLSASAYTMVSFCPQLGKIKMLIHVPVLSHDTNERRSR